MVAQVPLTLGTRSGTGPRKHWAALHPGRPSRAWDITLSPAALVAIEYRLASMGLLRLRQAS